MAPDEPMREDELEVVPFVQLGHTTWVLDQLWVTRAGRAHGVRPAGAAAGSPPGVASDARFASARSRRMQ